MNKICGEQKGRSATYSIPTFWSVNETAVKDNDRMNVLF